MRIRSIINGNKEQTLQLLKLIPDSAIQHVITQENIINLLAQHNDLESLCYLYSKIPASAFQKNNLNGFGPFEIAVLYNSRRVVEFFISAGIDRFKFDDSYKVFSDVAIENYDSGAFNNILSPVYCAIAKGDVETTLNSLYFHFSLQDISPDHNLIHAYLFLDTALINKRINLFSPLIQYMRLSSEWMLKWFLDRSYLAIETELSRLQLIEAEFANPYETMQKLTTTYDVHFKKQLVKEAVKATCIKIARGYWQEIRNLLTTEERIDFINKLIASTLEQYELSDSFAFNRNAPALTVLEGMMDALNEELNANPLFLKKIIRQLVISQKTDVIAMILDRLSQKAITILLTTNPDGLLNFIEDRNDTAILHLFKSYGATLNDKKPAIEKAMAMKDQIKEAILRKMLSGSVKKITSNVEIDGKTLEAIRTAANGISSHSTVNHYLYKALVKIISSDFNSMTDEIFSIYNSSINSKPNLEEKRRIAFIFYDLIDKVGFILGNFKTALTARSKIINIILGHPDAAIVKINPTHFALTDLALAMFESLKISISDQNKKALADNTLMTRNDTSYDDPMQLLHLTTPHTILEDQITNLIDNLSTVAEQNKKLLAFKKASPHLLSSSSDWRAYVNTHMFIDWWSKHEEILFQSSSAHIDFFGNKRKILNAKIQVFTLLDSVADSFTETLQLPNDDFLITFIKIRRAELNEELMKLNTNEPSQTLHETSNSFISHLNPHLLQSAKINDDSLLRMIKQLDVSLLISTSDGNVCYWHYLAKLCIRFGRIEELIIILEKLTEKSIHINYQFLFWAALADDQQEIVKFLEEEYPVNFGNDSRRKVYYGMPLKHTAPNDELLSDLRNNNLLTLAIDGHQSANFNKLINLHTNSSIVIEWQKMFLIACRSRNYTVLPIIIPQLNQGSYHEIIDHLSQLCVKREEDYLPSVLTFIAMTKIDLLKVVSAMKNYGNDHIIIGIFNALENNEKISLLEKMVKDAIQDINDKAATDRNIDLFYKISRSVNPSLAERFVRIISRLDIIDRDNHIGKAFRALEWAVNHDLNNSDIDSAVTLLESMQVNRCNNWNYQAKFSAISFALGKYDNTIAAAKATQDDILKTKDPLHRVILASSISSLMTAILFKSLQVKIPETVKNNICRAAFSNDIGFTELGLLSQFSLDDFVINNETLKNMLDSMTKYRHKEKAKALDEKNDSYSPLIHLVLSHNKELFFLLIDIEKSLYIKAANETSNKHEKEELLYHFYASARNMVFFIKKSMEHLPSTDKAISYLNEMDEFINNADEYNRIYAEKYFKETPKKEIEKPVKKKKKNNKEKTKPQKESEASNTKTNKMIYGAIGLTPQQIHELIPPTVRTITPVEDIPETPDEASKQSASFTPKLQESPKIIKISRSEPSQAKQRVRMLMARVKTKKPQALINVPVALPVKVSAPVPAAATTISANVQSNTSAEVKTSASKQSIASKPVSTYTILKRPIPRTSFISAPCFNLVDQDIVDILRAMGQNGYNSFNAYLVGGAVRDCLRGGEPRDYDITLFNMTEQQIVAKLHELFGAENVIDNRINNKNDKPSWTIHYNGKDIDFGMEQYARRDFTCNAVYWHPDIVDMRPGAGYSRPGNLVYDPHDGCKDIIWRRLRLIDNDPNVIVKNTKLIFRLVRFLKQFGPGWHVDPTQLAHIDARKEEIAMLPFYMDNLEPEYIKIRKVFSSSDETKVALERFSLFENMSKRQFIVPDKLIKTYQAKPKK